MRRIRSLLAIFLSGLVVSGVTSIPLVSEVNALVAMTGAHELDAGPEPRMWAVRLTDIQAALVETSDRFPFLFYGTDWLAFGHLMIALVFVGAWRDPVRNAWLFDYGLIACALVIPWALIFGEVRGVPVWWRLIDCSFGVLGAVPLLLARRLVRQLGESTQKA
ncbi:MAG TPA: hypothetical protein DCY13_08715 [Verrucomicrobiales bacterium]|nr:hypothetical protein [Verrucomicrobiales bacterium]